MNDAPDESTLIERLARHLAIQRDRDGRGWHAHVGEAAGILAIIKLPDPAMREAGDEQIWRAMINAALIERSKLPIDDGQGVPPGSADEEGDVPLPASGALEHDSASWVQVRKAPGGACEDEDGWSEP